MNDYNDMSAEIQASEIVEDDKVKPGTISFAGPGANRWKEIYKISPPPAGVDLID